MNADGTFTPAINVAGLNSPCRDTRTTIRRDGLEMLFASARSGSLSGSLDIWVASRGTTLATWSPPVDVGESINGTFNDGAPALSRDAMSLYFYRPGGSGANDLYVSRRQKISKKRK